MKNDRSFTRTNGTIKNDPNAKSAFLKILKWNGEERKGTDISLKERLKSGTRSYYQELHILSQERILNQECVLNDLEIIIEIERNCFR